MLTLIITAASIVVLVVLLSFSYVKAPPDEAYVISGLKSRTVIGKATLRLPFIERLDKLNLQMMSVDVRTGGFVPTKEYINVQADGAVKIKIGTDSESLRLAAENFLNQDPGYIVSSVKDVLEGNMREIIGQMTLPDMVTNRQAFSAKVQENAVPDLEKMGLTIIAFNVQDFTDEDDVIKNLGIDNVSQIAKTAAIAKADAEKEVAVAQAVADEEANEARVKADTEIAVKNNALEVKKSELKTTAEQERARAEIAYEIEQESQRKTLEEAKADAEATKVEKQIQISKDTLEAEVKNTAEAKLFEEKNKIDAQTYEIEQKANAELLKAQAEAKAIKIKAQADAEAIQLKKEAEAKGVAAIALAEAEGIQAKADAMKEYGEAAVLEMLFGALPQIAQNVAQPLGNVDKITMYGEGNSTKLVSDITTTMSKVLESVSEVSGINLAELVKTFTEKENK